MGRKCGLNCVSRGVIVKTLNPACTSVTALLPGLLTQFLPNCITVQQNYGSVSHSLIDYNYFLFYIIELI